MGKHTVLPNVPDSAETFRMRKKIMEFLSVTPIVALELARILQGIEGVMSQQPGMRYFAIVHGDKTKWQNIRSVIAKKFESFEVAASPNAFNDTGTDQVGLITAAGSEEELSQLGEVTTTFVLIKEKS